MATADTKTKFRPLSNRVLVKRVKEEAETCGGIILPDSAKQKQEIGEILAMGPGKKGKDGKLVEMTVKVGDKVMWDKFSGQNIDSVDSEELVIVKEDDIIAIII